jgi:DNA-binding GntR family transcriptional regulator
LRRREQLTIGGAMDKIRRTVLSGAVYDRIKVLILEGELQAGEKLQKHDLAKKIGVSLTPVNDALNRLSGGGYLEQREGQGFFVREYTAEDLREIFAVRAGLEGIAARICAVEHRDEIAPVLSLFDPFAHPLSDREAHAYYLADKEFHNGLLARCGNSFMSQMNDTYAYMMRSYQKGLLRSPEETLDEHRRIISAIREGDGEGAQLAMTDHLINTLRSIPDHVDMGWR